MQAFVSVYPGWYAGRATHIHVEVYVNGRSVKVTPIAFPEDLTAQVYSRSVSLRGRSPPSAFSSSATSDRDTRSARDGRSAGGVRSTSGRFPSIDLTSDRAKLFARAVGRVTTREQGGKRSPSNIAFAFGRPLWHLRKASC